MNCRRLTCESGFVKNRVHEVARRVPGEGTASSIRPVRAGSEPKNKNTRVGFSEARHGLAPIIVVTVCTTFFPCDELAVRDKAGTTRAGNNFTIELNEPVWVAGHRCDCTGRGARIYVESALDSNGGYHTQAVL